MTDCHWPSIICPPLTGTHLRGGEGGGGSAGWGNGGLGGERAETNMGGAFTGWPQLVTAR
jgi:hypothetical protein